MKAVSSQIRSDNTMAKAAKTPIKQAFQYIVLRNITTDAEKKHRGYKNFVGKCTLESVKDLENEANVRDYYGNSSKRLTEVHRKIQETLETRPEFLSILNKGITILATSASEPSEKNSTILLTDPQIADGAQTQGEIKEFLKRFEANPEKYPDFNGEIKFEIKVTDDEDLRGEIAVAANTQNKVETISIMGTTHQLDDLNAVISKKYPAGVKMSETDNGATIDTNTLIKTMIALTPPVLLGMAEGSYNELGKQTYSSNNKSLKHFTECYEAHKGVTPNPTKEQLYRFYMDIAIEAYELYTYWKENKHGYKWPTGTGRKDRGIESTGTGSSRRVISVDRGIIWPIISAYSVCVEKVGKKWSIVKPKTLVDTKLAEKAFDWFKDEDINSNPNQMGKFKAVYVALFEYIQNKK